jgi:hypothetical protein
MDKKCKQHIITVENKLSRVPESLVVSSAKFLNLTYKIRVGGEATHSTYNM